MAVGVITTVVTPASSYDLADLATVKAELDIMDGSKDALLKQYISSASAAASQYCNRVFQIETVKDEFWPQRDAGSRLTPGGVTPLQLSRFPIVAASVSALVENGSTLVDGTDFRVDYQRGQLLRLNAHQYPARWSALAISVQYKAGFATIPADVADAVLRMVSGRYLARGKDPKLMSESIPGVREARWWVSTGDDGGNLPPDVADLLNNYRVIPIAA